VLDEQNVDREAGDSPRAVRERERFDIRFPTRGNDVGQDEEWCEVGFDGTPRRLRFHDYGELYSVPGLYEQLFYDELECRSPATVCGLLREELVKAQADPTDLRVLDVGAGNGIVGEELERMGAGLLVGVDIIEEAQEATQRDRPGLYDHYYVVDLTDIPGDARGDLEDMRFNCLTSVAALGFGDIPPRAFAEAYNLVADGGWVAFTIKEDFLGDQDKTGFSQLIEMMLDEGNLERRGQRRYRHRLSMAREPLHYVAMTARKQSDVPLDWTDELND
jgi:predicted TPR repeat methyltransferase